jgi:hypothetical protein
MKLTTSLVALALVSAGGAASAATVGTLYDPVTDAALANNPVLGPTLYAAFEQDGPANATPTFDYVYNFQLNATSDLNVSGNTYTGATVAADAAAFTLYTGTSTGGPDIAANLVAGGPFSFAGQTIQHMTYSNLTAGNYFFEVTGSLGAPLGTSYNVTIQAPSDTGPLPAIPEPTNVALMLGGLGLFGFMAKRRSRQ